MLQSRGDWYLEFYCIYFKELILYDILSNNFKSHNCSQISKAFYELHFFSSILHTLLLSVKTPV